MVGNASWILLYSQTLLLLRLSLIVLIKALNLIKFILKISFLIITIFSWNGINLGKLALASSIMFKKLSSVPPSIWAMTFLNALIVVTTTLSFVLVMAIFVKNAALSALVCLLPPSPPSLSTLSIVILF